MGYQCMNGGGTACCATERGTNCLPTYTEKVDAPADTKPKGWVGKVPEGASLRKERKPKRAAAAAAAADSFSDTGITITTDTSDDA